MTLPSIRRQVLVACDPATAYCLFVEDIGTWWPLDSFGCFGEGSSVELDGIQFVETGPSGESAVWGSILEATPPHTVSFTWHPGRAPESASRVTVSFAPSGDATLVTLEHDGWESFADPAAARTEYGGGWVAVLDQYAESPANEEVSEHGDRWFVLEHTAAAGRVGAVFGDPDFPHHLAFLRTLATRGVLVAAGPLPDEPGNGMAVVRVPDLAMAREVIAAAQLDDGAVAAGLLEVRVRPWQVALSG